MTHTIQAVILDCEVLEKGSVSNFAGPNIHGGGKWLHKIDLWQSTDQNDSGIDHFFRSILSRSIIMHILVGIRFLAIM